MTSFAGRELPDNEPADLDEQQFASIVEKENATLLGITAAAPVTVSFGKIPGLCRSTMSVMPKESLKSSSLCRPLRICLSLGIS